ncbi:globin [Rathayibacter tanaceti]|uniref:Hemoglobin n=2 Tax=Rathayibacter tanaceti TaxID=1671680 RepID=A0ACD2XP87_9MICO|nr:globin [Rathayibacter tanaceti]KZX22683.1 Group 2 truncated hemoglobin GlbO [Rathayibacter tanaceti]TCO39636.1 hemoglobin [Rathayibacter tanaceti]
MSGLQIGGTPPLRSFWEHVGGRPTFERLVRRFYEGVREDDLLWPMYPAEDLEGAIQRLTGFLEQYWGGPGTYSQERGHPRLRMRHQPFRITPDARDHWLQHMRVAVDELELAPADETLLWDYLERAAHAMVNSIGQ